MSRQEIENLSRRGMLLRSVACAAGAATILTVAAEPAAAAQLPKAVVCYQEKPHDGQQCDQCALFVKPNSCQTVAGPISPNGWCRLYRKA